VDLRRLHDEYPKHVTRVMFKLVFTFIINPRLRELIKDTFAPASAFGVQRPPSYVLLRALQGASILGNTASTFQPTIGRLTC
jgi:hypothetical protein